jgi:hypothetical protein
LRLGELGGVGHQAGGKFAESLGDADRVDEMEFMALLGSLALPERLHDPLALFGKVLDLL